jgi:predicted RNase H-like HicB family nuclease
MTNARRAVDIVEATSPRWQVCMKQRTQSHIRAFLTQMTRFMFNLSKRGSRVLAFLGSGSTMLSIEIEREEDGRWIGEVPELPGVLVYGSDPAEARVKVTALAFRVIADRLEHGEEIPINTRDFFLEA